MRKYLFQRTTLFGIALIFCALGGVYFNLLEDDTAILLITFGASGFIPENCPMAHKILAFMAPLLVHEIRQKAPLPEDTKHPFDQAPVSGAFSFPKSELAGLFRRKPDFNLTYKMKEIFMNVSRETASPAATTGENTPSIMNIEAQIEQIITNLLGDKMSAGEKAKLHMIGSILGNIIGVLLPFAKNSVDIAELSKGLFALNAGILQEESGFKQILKSLKKENKEIQD